MPTLLTNRIAHLTAATAAKINAELEQLDSDFEQVHNDGEDLSVALDDWESTEDREERAEAKNEALIAADALLGDIALLMRSAGRLLGDSVRSSEPGPGSTVSVLPERPDPASPRGLMDTIFRLGATVSDDSVLGRLSAIRQLRVRLDDEEQQLAFGLRLRGETWQAIADYTGLASRQHALQKFQGAALLDKLDSAAHRLSPD